MIYFALGIITGFIFAVLCVSRLVIGKLTYVRDADGTYPLMVLNDPDIGKIFEKKFVVLEVGDSHE